MSNRRSTGGMVRRHPRWELWEARYTGADGRRHSIYTKTRREAQERLRRAPLDADHGIRPIGQRLTVAGYLEEWLATSVGPRCRPRTVESYTETVERYIAPAIGRLPLAKLEPEHVGRMLADLSDRGTLSASTIRYAHAVPNRAGPSVEAGQGRAQRRDARGPAVTGAPRGAPALRRGCRSAARGPRGDRLEALYTTA
jgi:hypothetical protein